MIHQPHFFPWMGYFNKLLNADHFIVLDDVQFRPRYFQNRTNILHNSGSNLWLSIPIVKTVRSTQIKQAKIANDVKWERKLLESIRYSYVKAEYFDETWRDIKNCIKANNNSLLSLNIETLQLVYKKLTGKELPMSLSSSYPINPQNPTDRLLQLCKAVNATHYLFGEGNGINYHGIVAFHDSNIQTIQQDFVNKHPTYKQQYKGFSPGLSILDAIFNLGYEKTYLLIKDSWKITEEI